MTATRHRISLWGDENVLDLDSIDNVYHCEDTKLDHIICVLFS
jgi:hypothetical protein